MLMTGDERMRASAPLRHSTTHAKACSPILDAIQCTKKVLAHPGCGCPTAINPDNTDAVEKLDRLQNEWDKLNCSEGIVCPAAACAPIDGVCGETSPGSTTGMCEDAVQE